MYLKGILDFIDARQDLDSTKVFVEGFSQSSMFSAYFTVCFADRIAGMFQSGSALTKTYHTPITPGFEGQCSRSDFFAHGDECCTEQFCENCKWWPIYPRTCEHKIISCMATYTGDGLACGGDYYQYQAMTTEGNDARMISFPGGSHSVPTNYFDWAIGCLGIVDSCSSQCENSFLNCVGSNPSKNKFKTCRKNMATLNGCGDGTCASTLEMLRKSEVPEVVNLSENKFGTQTGVTGTGATAQKPKCNFGNFEPVNNSNCQPPKGVGPAKGKIKACGTTSPPVPISPVPTVYPSKDPGDDDGTNECTLPGSNCFTFKKNEERTGCENYLCEAEVCRQRKSCCNKEWANNCKVRAKRSCPSCPCMESPQEDFFWKINKKSGEPVIKNCEWLVKQKKQRRKNACKKSEPFSFDSEFEDEVLIFPARYICPISCNLNTCKNQNFSA